jgi:hypothetical protein
MLAYRKSLIRICYNMCYNRFTYIGNILCATVSTLNYPICAVQQPIAQEALLSHMLNAMVNSRIPYALASVRKIYLSHKICPKLSSPYPIYMLQPKL